MSIRLSETTPGGVTTYTYDIANRLLSSDGFQYITYTYDNNGNLLSDGTRTYTYTSANRVSSIAQGGSSYSFVYNGLGDRLQQTVDAATTSYTPHLYNSLTQALSDGTDTYLYGNGRIGEQDTDWAYYLTDALGSVRQLTDSSAAVTFATTYQPYGGSQTSNGTSSSNYGFAGEWTDATGLQHLRARYYNTGLGRFIKKDPSGMEKNPYLYAMANPLTYTDPSGLITGLAAFGLCMQIHTVSQVGGWVPGALPGITAQDAVDICKLAYSKDAWTLMPFGSSPDTAHNLFGMYLNETGGSHLLFTAHDSLTQELAYSTTLWHIRLAYSKNGDTTSAVEYKFNATQQIECLSDFEAFRLSVPLTCLLGSFYYQVKEVEYKGEKYVGFRIDNRTDLESGTHIAFRFKNNLYEGSVEHLIKSKKITGNEHILDVMNNMSFDGKQVLSILDPLDHSNTGIYSGQYGTHELGGGNMTQTYVWMEKYDPCDPLDVVMFHTLRGGTNKREIWWNFIGDTNPITRWQTPY